MSAPKVSPMELGKFKLRQHEFPMAEKAFLQEVGLNPQNDVAWYYIGYCRRRLFKMKEALPAFEKAYSLNSTVPDYLYDLATTYLSVREIEKGKSIAQELQKMNQKRFTPEQIEKLLS